jgi:hypothetical protein
LADDGVQTVVKLMRVPAGEIQPQAAIDLDGTAHLIYFSGDPYQGSIFYVRLPHDGEQFTDPLRVNRNDGSAVAAGNVRGAHLALGRRGRVHVAWMGSAKAEPKAPDGAAPMLYARLNDAGSAFETERNVITRHTGLDGGGSLAADTEGHVYVTWHAPPAGQKGEANRRVWVAASDDDGETFSAERPAFDEATGCCGCCGMRSLADRAGNLYTLYRSASQRVHRDMYLVIEGRQAENVRGIKVAEWQIATCVMSTAALNDGPTGVIAAWETEGQVFYGRVDAAVGPPLRSVAAAGAAGNRKHPVIAGNGQGHVLLAWTEGMSWGKGGALAWQVFDSRDRPIDGAAGKATGVPAWSVVAAWSRPDGSFVVIY